MSLSYEEFFNLPPIGDPPPDLNKKDQEAFRYSVIRLIEMNKLLRKSADICQVADVPLGLNDQLQPIIGEYIEIHISMEIIQKDRTINPQQVYDRITNIHRQFFELSSSNKTLQLLSTINLYQNFYAEDFNRNLNILNNDLIKKNDRAESILQKLENPSAHKVLSDYSKVYLDEENNNRNNSLTWIVIGVLITIVFLVLIPTSIYYNWFPSTLWLSSKEGNATITHQTINYPILITKLMVISLIIYVITFSFKQYSIYKNLQVISQQKKHALNSFTLFAAAQEKDEEAKRALLMALAKMIYESSHTGFLSSKSPDQGFIQSFDFGKISGKES